MNEYRYKLLRTGKFDATDASGAFISALDKFRLSSLIGIMLFLNISTRVLEVGKKHAFISILEPRNNKQCV